ncbi:uncharacterized protein TNCV_4487071 [Trichonephila clavipes]|nr:uncharacterized protein TNCV_4487071 [Trichonephila clavipes]
MAVDKSCDINDTTQVSLFVRFMSHSGPKEELLGLLLLKGQTHGEDIAKAVIECMDKHHIPLDKLFRFQQMGPKVLELIAKSCLEAWQRRCDEFLTSKHSRHVMYPFGSYICCSVYFN